MFHLKDRRIADAWERSKKYGASFSKAKDAILSKTELLHHLKMKEEFLAVAKPTLEQLATNLKKSQSSVVISNPASILLHSIGDPSFLKDTEKIYLKEGACWSEEVRGTNSAGTVSVINQPIAIVGKEHYLEEHHVLYCVGAPVFNPHGVLQAVLNITGHTSIYHPFLLNLVDIISRNIENDLLIRMPDEKIVFSFYPEGSKEQDSLIAINKHGNIIGANRKARALLPFEKTTKNPPHIEDLFIRSADLFTSSPKPISVETTTNE